MLDSVGRFVLRRLFHFVFVVVGISVVVFVFLHLSGDPARLLSSEDASEEEVAQLRRQIGLEDPLYVQYLRFLRGVVRADFGMSFRHNAPALGLVLERMPATLELGFVSLVVAVLVAVPMGVLSAIKHKTIGDSLVKLIALLGQSIPTFWLGLMLILVLSVQFHLFPTSGRGSVRQLALPCLTLACFVMARITRLTRAGMLEVLRLDYVKTARAKGLGEGRVILVHAFKNALIPIVTLVGMELGALFGGAVVTEIIFAWPGVGRLAIQAIYGRDFPVVQAAVFVLAITFVVVNFAVDLLYTYLDPRIKYG